MVAALARRDWMMARSYRGSYVVEGLTGLFGVAIYYFISQTFPRATAVGLGEAPSYFAFALAGIVITMVLQTAAVALAQRLREEQLTGTIEALLTQPVRDAELALGLAAYPYLFATIRAFVYLLVADVLFGLDLGDADVAGLVLVLAAAVLVTLGLGLLVAALVVTLKRATQFAALMTYALAILGGAYFPIQALPGWLEPIARVAPTRLAFDGVRSALFGGGRWTDELAGLLALAVLLVPFATLVFSRALLRERRRGTLVEY